MDLHCFGVGNHPSTCSGCMEFGILAIAVLLARSRWRPPPTEKTGFGLDALIDPSMRTWKFLLLIIFAFFVPFGYGKQ